MLFDEFELGVFGLEMPREELYNPQEGLLHGNLFIDSYRPYKNYNCLNLVACTEKEKLLLDIYALDFAINDLNLYLDLHPQDQNKYLLFKEYVNKYDHLSKRYEKEYGPLCLEDISSIQYVWYKNPWPWESEGAKYV